MKFRVTFSIALTLCVLLSPCGLLAAGPALLRTDSQINFNWGSGSPGPGVPADDFSVRWTGSIRLPRDGKYTFYTVSDDGIRLWVDDQLVIDNWTNHGETENQGQIELWGARPHPIRVEYFENTSAAVAKLLWSGPGVAKQVIPSQFLFSDLWPESTTGTGLRAVYYVGTKLDGTTEGTLPKGAAEGWAQMAKLGRGFVIWESNRMKAWRIWHRALDGSDLRQVSPDETDREHFAPHISPDGTRFIYLSYPKGKDGYQEDDAKIIAPMYVINIDGSGLRQIASNARCYYEDRAVVWLNNDELIYIAANRGPTRLNLRTGASQPLSPKGHWLINRTMTCASTGDPTFSPYDSAKGTITEQPTLGGCQPYFSTDGVWGYWMGGAGGPINRIRLATREVSHIMELNDKRLPADRNYLYFPMLSYGQRLFAFAASPGVHDHFNADYDIFVAPCDPNRLELTGTPVRYTFNDSCDRFPDAFLADFDLGTHDGKAPFTVDLMTEKSRGDWTWNFGDGSSAGRDSKHTFTNPGEYEVRASQADRILLGHVHVRVAQPPSVQSVFLQGDRDVVVEFDEPIQIAGLQVKAPAGIKVASRRAEKQRLILTLASELKKETVFGLSGISDLAQKPNALSTNVIVRPIEWPTDRNGLVFAWRTGDIAVNAINSATGQAAVSQLTRRNAARLDHNFAILLNGGSCVATNAETSLLNACRASNGLTIEATITPANVIQEGPARIVTFSSDPLNRNFTLGQQKSKLILRLRTPQTGLNGTPPELELCSVESNRTYRVVVTYSGGKVSCYLDGVKTLDSSAVQGDFSNWTPQHLVFGDEWNGQRNWSGTLEGVALFSRALNADEAKREYDAYQRIRASRPPIPHLIVEAELIKLSKAPTLKEILPYRDALFVGEYRIKRVVAGKLDTQTVRVAHWALLDGAVRTPVSRKPGWVGQLNLEPFDANSQLKSLFMSETLEDNFEAVLFYDSSI